MLKQKSLELRDVNYIYENSLVWVNINSIKRKNVALYREIFEYYKNKNTIFCFFKGKVKNFVSKNEVEICIDIDDSYNTLKNTINYNITENVKYLLPVDTNFGCSDNTELIYLNPPNLLENIYQRYNKAYLNEESRNCIYTYIGYILLSVNPYKNFEIYDEKYMNKVREENNLFSIPHPFSIANDAYNCLIKDKISQSIIISGESGSGKTESSKQVLKYLTYLSSFHRGKKKQNEKNYEKIENNNDDFKIYNINVKNKDYKEYNLSDINDGYNNNNNDKRKDKLNKCNNINNIYNNTLQKNIPSYEEKIQNSNPLLESFGNAKTIKNDNSSRFGKLMKLNYNKKGILSSASIETYLLAKSRVVDVPYGESNYHIFYSLCQNEKLRNEFNLLPWYKYNYLKEKSKINKFEDNEKEDEEENEEEEKEKDNTENKKKQKNKKNKMEKEKEKGKEKEKMENNKNKKNKRKNKPSYDEVMKEQNKNYKCLYDLETIINCFHSIGVSENEQKEIYKTLICILLLGNVDFIENEDEGKALRIKNMDVCDNLNKLLEIKNENSDINKITEILTIKKVRETQKNYTYQQAIYNRDVISKALYQLLFEYIISRVNDSLNANEEEEYFENNSECNFESEVYITNDEDFNEEKKKSEIKKKKKRKSHKKKRNSTQFEGDEEDENCDFNNKNYFIGILDIYGFENFSLEGINGFEQLCINYANEILHSFFLKQIIHNEQKIHYEENLYLEKLHYNDNSNVISLIGDTRDVSIYTILEDLALLSSSNKSSEKNKNDSFFEKLNKNIINSAKYKCIARNYKLSNNSFIISHYAGDVLYDSGDFFNKNVDILTTDIEEFLSNCNPFISVNLLKKKRYENKKTKIKKELKTTELKIDETKTNKRKLSVKEMISNHEIESKNIQHNNTNNIYKNKVKSIFSYFKKQLEVLTNKLDKTSSKFIRCIKPNEQKQAKFFNKNLVLNQLIMSGMVDILNLMKNGFPCRVLYDDIWINYSNILQDEMKEFLTPKMFCEIVLKFLEINTNEYTFGKTKVFFRFGVLSIINEILNKNEKKKNKFIECVYKFWMYRRKKRLLNFVLCVCRFKILFKKQRAKKLMEAGLNLYNNYLYKKKLQSVEKIVLYYFNVYKQRIYFLKLRNSSIIIQKHFRKYIVKKKYLYMKRQILFIQDYYLFQKYFKRRVNAANVIRKNWLMYITKSDYQYVLRSIKKIQRAFKKYMKRRYINYCLKIANIKQKKKNNNILMKKEMEDEEKKKCLLPTLNKYLNETNRVGSFIYVEKKKHRHSFTMGEKLNSSSKSKNSFKKRKTLDSREKNLKYEYNTIHTFKYKHLNNIKNENEEINNLYTNENNTFKKEIRNSYIEDKPFISVGNTIKSEKNKIKGVRNFIFSKSVNKENIKNKFRFSNLSICSGSSHKNLKNNNGKNDTLKFNNTNKIQMKRSTYNHGNTKVDFTSSYKREKKKVSNFIKSTIYDRYIDKYKQNHMSKQKEKKKKSVYIKSNYSNISNIYSVYKPTKTEKLKEQYNFDLMDTLIIPEDFYVYESSIPEPNIEQENNENYILLCNYLDKNLDSKIPLIDLDVFKNN